MGVAYKLSAQVIEFIKDKKSESPKMGCRKISDLATEHFQTKISKSSVNNVLKELELSSPVGRPPKKRRKKDAFKIPEAKKEDIRAGLASVLNDEKGPMVVSSVDIEPEKIAEPVQIKPVVHNDNIIEDKIEEAQVEHPIEIVTVKEKMSDFKDSNESLSLEKKEISYAGSIFLKAAEWMLNEKPLLPGLFPQVFSSFEANEAEMLSAGMLFSVITNRSKNDIVALKRSTPFIDQEKFKHIINKRKNIWVENLDVTNSSTLQYLSQKQEKPMGVEKICIQYENKSQLILDPYVFSLDDHEKLACAGIDLVMRRVSNMIISNNFPCVLHHIKDLHGDIFAQFRQNSRRELKIENVKILDKDGDDILTYKVVPHNSRKWIFGLYASHKEFINIEKALKWAEKIKIYNYLSEQEYFCSEVYVDMFDKEEKVRCVGVYSQGETLECVLGTNDQRSSVKEIVEAYTLRWPFFATSKERREPLVKDNQIKPNFLSFKSFFKGNEKRKFNSGEELLRDFKESLHEQANKWFFSGNLSGMTSSKALERVYSLDGNCYENEKVYKVSIFVDKEQEMGDFLSAADVVNSQEIYTYKKQRLWVDVWKKV